MKKIATFLSKASIFVFRPLSLFLVFYIVMAMYFHFNSIPFIQTSTFRVIIQTSFDFMKNATRAQLNPKK